ncbi:MAG: hypothetical protein SPG40_03210 [Kiritimatiellia bacterium]|nr:hypothetical protein [Kiritimatiellia bacterium]
MERLRYNERTGEFEERPARPRARSGCAKRLFQLALAFATFAATAWIVAKWESGWRPSIDFGGVSALFSCILPSSESVGGFFSGCWQFVYKAGDWALIVAMVAVFVVFVRYYAKALADVRCGRLIVYLGWGDFFWSAAWILAIPFGLACAFSDENNLFTVVLGLVIVGYGVKSFVRMVKGAFRYNSGTRRWLALFARIAVILLLLFALSELQSRYERYKRGQLGLIRGVLLPLVIFGYFYKAFVAPMIGSHLYGLHSSFQR